MKKILMFLMLGMFLSSNAKAESIVVIDQNGTVVRQMFTMPTTYTEPVQVVQTVPTQTVSVVRESPVIQNSYYYDSYSTNQAIAAGVTTAVVGGLLFHGFRGHHHRGHFPRPHHGGHRRH